MSQRALLLGRTVNATPSSAAGEFSDGSGQHVGDAETDLQRHADDYMSRATVAWNQILEPGGRYVPLPTYPWQYSDYPIPAAESDVPQHILTGPSHG